MNAERLFPSGAWMVSDIVNGQYVKHVYYGDTKREAIRHFRQKVRDIKAGRQSTTRCPIARGTGRKESK